MAKSYRLGVACLSHDHVWNELVHWQKLGNVEIVAGGDDEPELLAKLQAEFGVTRVYNSFQEMIANEDLDLIRGYRRSGGGKRFARHQ